jgi:hypothetical protein
MPPSKKSAVIAAAEDSLRADAQRALVHSLRMAGATPSGVARALDLPLKEVRALLTPASAGADQQVDSLRELESERLDAAQLAIWPQVEAGDLAAVSVFLKLSARRSRLLGLEAPLKIDMSIRREMTAAFEDLQRVVLGQVIYADDPPPLREIPHFENTDPEDGEAEVANADPTPEAGG